MNSQSNPTGRIPTAGIVALLILAVLMAYAVYRVATKEDRRAGTPAQEPSAVPDTKAPDRVELKDAWNIDYTASHIKFTGMDSGAAFDGEWLEWTAAIHFESTSWNASSFDVQIMTAAVETGNDDRDRHCSCGPGSIRIIIPPSCTRQTSSQNVTRADLLRMAT